MVAEEELAFKAHLKNLPPAVLRHLKRDIVAEKRRREATTTAKGPGPGEKPTGLCSGRQSGPAREESAPTQKATACKRKANDMDSSSSGGSSEPAARRPAPGPLSEAGSAPLHAEAVGPKFTTDLGVNPKGEQAAENIRQLSRTSG
jgi:hypothetical protein